MENVSMSLLVVFAVTACSVALASPEIDIWPYFMNAEEIKVNKTKLFLLASNFYVVPPICSNTSLPNSETLLETINSPPCSCFYTCHRPACCLDHPYSAVPYSCVNVLVYPKHVHFKSEYQMVTTCELHGLHYAQLCNMNTNTSLTFDDPILTSIKSGRTYKNKYCALCHLEQESDLVSWASNLYCIHDLTKVAMTSLDIMTLLVSNIRNGTCIIAYFPGRLLNSDQRCLFDKINSAPERIQTCNVSGLWMDFDADLSWACEHFDLPYRGFKNVFCYICNPSIVSERKKYYIDHCNKTGLWQNFDLNVFNRCQKFPSEPRWRPFRNLYCLLCNVYDSNMNPTKFHLMPLYSYTNISMSEWYDNNENQFTTLIRTFNASSVKVSSTVALKMRVANTCHNRVFCPEQIKDAKDFADCDSCSCSSTCPIKMSCCRRYMAEEETFMCIPDELVSDTNSSSENAFLAIGSCPNQTDELLRKKCEDLDTEDILQVLPVTASNEFIFTNVYCAQCNGILQSKPFDLIVQCNIYIDAALFPTLEEFLKFILQENCKIKYLSPTDCGETGHKYISRCNTTGMWETWNTRIQWACEFKAEPQKISRAVFEHSVVEYMHFYCYVCKPNENMPLDSNCNVTKRWNTYKNSDDNLCQKIYPEMVLGPFKNIYCLICNIPEHVDTVYKDSDGKDILQLSYRTIFQMSPNFFEAFTQEESTSRWSITEVRNMISNVC
ncbi:hypothetical protein CHS0354_039614, partial [Potamilus streckersoni]